MSGYVIAAIMIGPSEGSDVCFGILCWRLPLLVEWLILVPFSVAVHFVPSAHLTMCNKRTKMHEKQQARLQQQHGGYQPLLHRRRHSMGGPAARVSDMYGSMGTSSRPTRPYDTATQGGGTSQGRIPLCRDTSKGRVEQEGQGQGVADAGRAADEGGMQVQGDEEALVSASGYIDDEGGRVVSPQNQLRMSHESPVSG